SGREVALRDHLPVPVKYRRREIVAFADGFRESRPAHRRSHLLGDRDQAFPEHRQGNGVNRLRRGGLRFHDSHHRPPISIIKCPFPPTVALSPGRTTVVASRSSMSAGPSTYLPGTIA